MVYVIVWSLKFDGLVIWASRVKGLEGTGHSIQRATTKALQRVDGIAPSRLTRCSILTSHIDAGVGSV